MKSKEEQLEEIFLRLPLLPNAKEIIPHIVNEVLVHAGLVKVNELPRAKNCSQKTAEKELATFVKKAENLQQHILKMHQTSLVRFDDDNIGHPIWLNNILKHMVVTAQQPFNENSHIQTETYKSKIQASEATIFIARAYNNLTGLDVKRCWDAYNSKEKGRFNSFLEQTFKVLEIDASANSQTKMFKEKERQKLT